MVTKFFNIRDISQWSFTPYQILVLGFAGLILFGACLLSLPVASQSGQSIRFVDALFTATSAVCVTGLVVVDTGTTFSTLGQMLVITLIQIGGLGIITITTLFALIVGKKIKIRERLVMQEALNQYSVSGIVRLTLYVIKFTVIIEFIGGTILAFHWYPEYGSTAIYYGYWHAVSNFCNAGFDLFGGFRSLTHFVDDIVVNLVITSLIILGGIGFSVLVDVWEHRKFSLFSLHSKVVLTSTAFLLIFGTVVILLLEMNNPATLQNADWQTRILGSWYQSVTARTAGSNTLDIGQMTNASLFFITLLMFIGASPGSVGGGIKTTTASVLVCATWAYCTGKRDAELFERRISQELVYKSFTVMFLAGSLIAFITMLISINEPKPFLNILFEVTSAFGTVGLSTGITPQLSDSSKALLILTMFTGRVGPATLALALALRQRKGMIKYPEGKINIG